MNISCLEIVQEAFLSCPEVAISNTYNVFMAESENVLGFPLGSPQTAVEHFIQHAVSDLLEGRTVVLRDITQQPPEIHITTLDADAVATMRRCFLLTYLNPPQA